MTNNQQLAAHCREVIANPALYCIVDPDGLPYMSELCVATEPGVLEDEVAAMNDELEDGEARYSVQPLFFSSEPVVLPETDDGDPGEMHSPIVRNAFSNGFNFAIEEVKRLNAIRAAPIEPICATGGAEWVKCCDGKPDIDVTVWCYGQYDDGSDDTDNYAFPGYMDKKGRWFACNNGDYVDGGYGNDYRACVARWMSLPAAPEEE